MLWRQACAGRKNQQNNVNYLGVLRNLSALASHVLPTLAQNTAAFLADAWIADLPVATAQYCVDLGYYTGLESVIATSIAQQQALVDVYAAITKCNPQTLNALVLRRQDSVHLLLHLLDISLRCGYIDPSKVLCGLRDAVSALACTKPEDRRQSEVLWLALVNIAGATISRYSSLTSEGLLATLDIAFQAVQSISLFNAQSQSAVLALVYVLADTESAPIDHLIAQLISECISAGQTYLKLATGQLLLRIRNSYKHMTPGSVESIYKLTSDISSPRVRDVWCKVACLVDVQTLAPSVHPFARQRRALRDDFGKVIGSRDEATNLAHNISIDDAILIVKLVAESLNDRALAPVCASGDFGLSSSAFDAIMTIACDLCQKSELEKNGAYVAVDTVILAAGLKIYAADTQESTVVTSYLLKAVNEAVRKPDTTSTLPNDSARLSQPISDDSTNMCGLFWILEIVFHLCQPSSSTSSFLKSPGSAEILLRAAHLCGHFTFALFVFQTVASDTIESNTKDTNSTKERLQQLAQAAHLRQVSALLDGEISDSTYSLTVSSAEPVDDVTDALYGLSLADIPSGAASRLANYEASHERIDDNVSPCFVAGDHLLGHALARTAECMVLPDSGVAPFKLKALEKLASNDVTGDQRLQALGYLFRQGYVSPATAFSLVTKQKFVSGIRDEAKVEWTQIFTASRISAEYFQGATASPLVTVSPESPFKLLSFSPKYKTNRNCDLPNLAPHTQHLHELLMPEGVTIDIEELSANRLPDTSKAKEALLYYGCTFGGLPGSIENALFTSVLLDHVDRIRFTQTGVFDPVAKFVSLVATRTVNAPQITAPVLNANAVSRLAYYIPQLFAMLCSKGKSSSDDDRCIRSRAFSILESIAESSPDLVVFYAAVAKNSLSATSAGSKYAAKLLQKFDMEKVADIEAFVNMASNVAVLPQEKLRWVALKAKSAHLKAVARYQQGRFGTPARADETSAAIMDPLKPALQILSDYAERTPRSSVEQDFCASLPRLQLLFEQLFFSDSFGQDDPQLKHGLEQIWNEIFKTLATAMTLSIGYISTQLARFSAAVPIPMLTSPTEPVYFSQVSSTVRVIGSKTRPKLITLYLSTKSGEIHKEKYILKGSEDLRIDESVMQTFIRMNRVTASTFLDGTPCREEVRGRASDAVSSLSVYNVVPLSTYGGLIQVIDNAPSLFQIYSQHAVRRNATGDASIYSNRADVATSESGSNTGTTSRDIGVYGEQSSTEPLDEQKQQKLKLPPAGFQQVYMSYAQNILKKAKINPGLPFEKWPTSVASKVYDAVATSVPADLLYQHMLKSSQSPSHLYLLMTSMVRSISMSSIVGYVLGLGDRHLDNLLVDTRRGRLVQIDFNVCYDFGSVSHVPENVPFRMTPILSYICGSSDQIRRSQAAAALPFAYSRIFMNAATSVLLFCRMDRDALVNALASRVLFQPFKEWCVVEEAHLMDSKRKNTNNDAAILPPIQAPSGNTGEQESTMTVPGFIRTTGICPPNAFWRLGSETSDHGPSVSPEAASTELKYGWRIAQAAIERVDARLDYKGSDRSTEGGSACSSDRSVDALVEEQVLAVWEAAASKERLAKMYIGWAPWV
ncbi:hypothetical protein LPJ74_005872 [Coemansia sp. RSA 1843]|nr:hypothetical protein LPJ74_005872 [Coemansia sp. RSA 1843]